MADTKKSCKYLFFFAKNKIDPIYRASLLLLLPILLTACTVEISLTSTATTSSLDDLNISTIAAQSTNEDVAIGIAFTLTDAQAGVTCTDSVTMTSTNITLVPNANVVWSGVVPNCTGTVTPAANEYGVTDLTFTVTNGTLIDSTTFTMTVVQQFDDLPSVSWPFNFLSDALYSFTGTVIRLVGGVAELIGAIQTDSSATESTDGTYTAGSGAGLVYDLLSNGAGSGLKLGDDGGCNGILADCAKQAAAEIYELNNDWTPQWGSLVSYYKMDNNAWVDSKGTNHATAINGASFTTTSKIGSHAGVFDGTDDFVYIADSPSLNFGSALTVALWAKGMPQDDSFLVGDYDRVNTLRSWKIGTGRPSEGSATNVWGVKVSNNGSSAGPNVKNYYSSKAVFDGNWVHLAFTFNAGAVKLYVNGVEDTSPLVVSNGSIVSLFNSTAPKGIGARVITGNTLDGSPFNGSMDEIGWWNTVLTAREIQAIYLHQKDVFSGTFTSRVMNAIDSSSWTTLSWIPTLPFYKELPDSTCAPTPCTHNNPELSANYSSLVGSTGNTGANDLMTGIIGLWHLNENLWADVAGEIKDDSGQGHDGVGKNGANTTAGGRFGKAGYFDGSNDLVSIPYVAALAPTSAVTASAWFKTANKAVVNQAIFSTTHNGGYALHLNQNSTCPVSTLCFVVRIGGAYQVVSTSNTAISTDNWHHVVGKYDGSFVRLYLDGVEVGTPVAITGPIEYSGAPASCIGAEANTLGCGNEVQFFKGWIDEVAIWNRGLHANEISQLYQRGASRIKYQVRSCYDAACLYKDAINTPANWQGPDGTSKTFFSELNNNTIPLTGLGDVNATMPSMLFADFTSPPADNQYFQYRVILESDSSVPSEMPELKSTTVDPPHYPIYLSTDTTPANTIIGVNGVAFYELNAFTQTLGAGGCSNGVVYNLGLSNAGPWMYWTGAAWVAADGSSGQANTAADLVALSNAALTAFSTDVGLGTVYFKAFLTSTGSSKCELDNLLIGLAL